MKNLQIKIEINPSLYSKNPDTSELGRKIISKSIEMIAEMGLEKFTFKKLGNELNSPESSVYRYFKNKQILLAYLTSWYWTWTEYRLVFATTNIESPEERLRKSLAILTQSIFMDDSFSYINEVLLSEIVFSESMKTYHTKDVDENNKKGFFTAYKNVVTRVADITLEIKSDFSYSRMLISTVIEGAHQQKFFAEHLPLLTDVNEKKSITDFYTEMVFKILK